MLQPWGIEGCWFSRPLVYGPEATVMVLDRALGESVKRGAAPGRDIEEVSLDVEVVRDDDDKDLGALKGIRAVELASSGRFGMF